MKVKYITAESLEAAGAIAAKIFGADKSEITVEIMGSIDDGTQNKQFLALAGTQGEKANMNACYGIYYETDGVYLEMYESRGGGIELDSQMLMQHLSRKSITGISVPAIQDIVGKGRGRIKIAPVQKEHVYGEDIVVEVGANDMEASARLLAPEPGGAVLDMETAKKKLEAAGIIHGIDEQAVSTMLNEKFYDGTYIIAAASLPVDGEDGRLIFNFSSDERTGRPREIGGGRVDYRTLDLYEPVTEGQLLVTRILATPGTAGMTVKGRELKQKPGKEASFPRGKNVTINAEKTEMYAMFSGMVQLANNSVNVSNVYKVNGDCDLSVGNIDFDGCVHISGCLRSGNTIKATGSVIIGGVMEAATVIAGGNVEIKNGMQGADKGRVESGGTVTALYIERGTVKAEGSINVDVSIHSRLETGGTLTAKGKRGAIIGGSVGAAGNVIANGIGAISNAATEVAVGVVLGKRERAEFLEKEIERLKGEIVKLDQLDAYLEKSKEKLDHETWDKLYRSGVENRRLNQEILTEHSEEVGRLKYELEHATEGKVHVFDKVFPGSKIIIGSDMYKVHDEISYATFRYKDGQVIYGPCDLSKS